MKRLFFACHRFHLHNCGFAALLSVIGLMVSCGRLIDAVRPFSPSTVSVAGVVIDSTFNVPIGTAMVQLVNTTSSTTADVAGHFQLGSVATGKHELMIAAPGYDTLITPLEVTLDQPEVIRRLSRTDAPPEIGILHIDTADHKFLSDTLTITFSASDSTGGIIAVNLTFDDTAVSADNPIVFNQPVYTVQDSFMVCCFSPGSYSGTISIFGERNDTTTKTVTLELSQPRKPGTALLRTGPEGFITGKPGYLQIIFNDPDSVMNYYTIDWGDESDQVTSYDLSGTFWHVYTIEQTVTILVRMFGSDGVIDSVRLEKNVIKIKPPTLDNNLTFLPSQYLAPHDSVMLIGVRVLDIKDDSVKQIIWVVNENDPLPAFAYYRDTTGAHIDSLHNLLVHEFSTAGFKGTNVVEVRVVDGDNNSSTAAGTFYIAGRGD